LQLPDWDFHGAQLFRLEIRRHPDTQRQYQTEFPRGRSRFEEQLQQQFVCLQALKKTRDSFFQFPKTNRKEKNNSYSGLGISSSRRPGEPMML
jgi:hypothetical protein